MNSRFAILLGLLVLMLVASSSPLFTQSTATAWPPPSPDLQQLLDSAVAFTLEKFAPANLQSNQLAVTLVDLRAPLVPRRASFRGDAPTYPASVVKLFYLAAAHRWLEDGKLADTEELRRAMRDMVVDSSNEATHYVVDLLTGTTSGPELPPPQL